ncbi:uncharacterized protein BDZ83DRAFT_638321 [Colletotrichum acutatum]|uniref:Uncharacterized protein n=1 Tax=Glomerella acutata TaxID=27357 RepID=A0AAD8UCU9_GLOAC|nr:uncharacterized protein BDZ83DRAFT_638321 [Colletotrichum acutatum]KAK1712618.1 hypothetical protein BDZ83DRAFT_638321 [Colletotrichum acutatum]
MFLCIAAGMLYAFAPPKEVGLCLVDSFPCCSGTHTSSKYSARGPAYPCPIEADNCTCLTMSGRHSYLQEPDAIDLNVVRNMLQVLFRVANHQRAC